MKTVEQSIPKVDGMGLVTGKPAYTDDLAPSNTLIVKVLRSPYAFAKIIKIDKSEAEKLNGVLGIITYKDVPQNIITRAGQGYPEPSPHDKRILDKYVRYIGDEVAAVAAIDQDIAEAALKLIKVEYEVFEPVLNFEEAVAAAIEDVQIPTTKMTLKKERTSLSLNNKILTILLITMAAIGFTYYIFDARNPLREGEKKVMEFESSWKEPLRLSTFQEDQGSVTF